MYLSDRDLENAIQLGQLIVDPPTKIGPTSIDLHLDRVEEAKVWDEENLRLNNRNHGIADLELRISRINYGNIAKLYLADPPAESAEAKVFRRGRQVILRPGGFLLWQTKEKVGTPEEDPRLICFIDGKSTRARTGLVIHLTAPTIHAGWSGKITLEIANLGPFHFVLEENDVVAQITVAQISSFPRENMEKFGSVTKGQGNVGGTAG